jgi:CheY-like chemotaxis protein
MNAVLGIANLLQENDPRPDQLEMLKLLQFSGENLLTIINEILDFSKLEANKVVLEPMSVNLHQLIKYIKLTLEPRAVEKGIELHLEIDSEIPEKLITDPSRLTQILTNLTGNAIKFTETGRVDIKVCYLGKSHNLHNIRFEVRDTGIGIAAENISRIFEEFSQAEAETSRKFGGTGLGLSIAKKLLSLMGSRINVESTPGVGSVFSFTMLLEDGAGKTNAQLSKVLDSKNAIKEGLRVLLVEDNRINQMVASQFITKWGIHVDLANDGVEAIEKVKMKVYDLVLMDLEMPRMNGYQASSEIRKLSGKYFQTLPVLALTASVMNGIKEKVMGFGMNDYVAKPFSPSELRDKIAEYTLKKFIGFSPT